MVGEEVGHVPFLSVSLFVSLSSALPLHQYCKYIYIYTVIYKLGCVTGGSTPLKVQKDGCSVPATGLYICVESISPRGWTLYVESRFHGPMGIRAIQVTNQRTSLLTTRF